MQALEVNDPRAVQDFGDGNLGITFVVGGAVDDVDERIRQLKFVGELHCMQPLPLNSTVSW